MIRSLSLRTWLAAFALAAVVGAQDEPARPSEPVAPPGGEPVEDLPSPELPPKPAPVRPPVAPKPVELPPALPPPPAPGIEEVPDFATTPSPAVPPVSYLYAPVGESALPPDLSLSNARSFTMGLGPSALGSGIRSTVRFGVVYDDNIDPEGRDSGDFTGDLTEDGEEEKQSDLIFSAGADIRAEFGQQDRGISLNYIIDGLMYLDHSDENSVNHAVGVGAYRRWGRTHLGATLGYTHATGEDRDVGGSATQDTFSADINLTQGVGSRGRIEAGVGHGRTYYEIEGDSNETVGRLGYTHLLGTKLRLGLQGVVGSLKGEEGTSTFEQPRRSTPPPPPAEPAANAGNSQDPGIGDGGTSQGEPTAGDPAPPRVEAQPEPDTSDEGLDQTYEQVNLTFDYHATDKLNATGSIGWEWRSTDGGGTEGDFVYDLNLRYRFGPGTTIAARGSRRTSASASATEESRLSTNFEVSVSQPIGRRCLLELAGGYELAEYDEQTSGAGAAREDTFFYLRPALRIGLSSRLSMSIFYEFRRNDSTGEDGLSYEGNRIGTQFSYSF